MEKLGQDLGRKLIIFVDSNASNKVIPGAFFIQRFSDLIHRLECFIHLKSLSLYKSFGYTLSKQLKDGVLCILDQEFFDLVFDP
jgi:hypothetical protein